MLCGGNGRCLNSGEQSKATEPSEGELGADSDDSEELSSSDDEYEVVPRDQEIDLPDESEETPLADSGPAKEKEKSEDSPSWGSEEEEDDAEPLKKRGTKRKIEFSASPTGRTLRSQTKSPAAGSKKISAPSSQRSKRMKIQSSEVEKVAGVNSVFVSTVAKHFWRFASSKNFNAEKVLDLESSDEFNLKELPRESNLLFSATGHTQFVKKVVKEFYCNLPAGIDDKTSPDYQKVYVRGKTYNFSPKIICDVLSCWNPEDEYEIKLNEVAWELTGGRRSEWKVDGKAPKPSELSSKYAALHRVEMANWMPVRHTNFLSQKLGTLLFKAGCMISFNLGEMAYNQIFSFAGQQEKISVYVFPATIYRLLIAQGLQTLEDEEFTSPDTIKLTARLIGGEHVVDISDDDDVEVMGVQQQVGGFEEDPLSHEATIRATIQFLKKQEYQLKKKRLALEAHLARQ